MRQILLLNALAPPAFQHWAWRLLPLWCALLLVACTPFSALGRDLWTDEAYSASYTFHPTLLGVLDDVRKNEETPPVYFILTWLWARPFGHSEVALRGFSLLAGALAVALFARLAQRRLPPASALVAAGVMTAAPLVSLYLLEARGYTLTLLLAVGCVIAFERLYEAPRSGRALVAYSLVAAALFLTSYFGVALLLAHNVVWLLRLARARAHRVPLLLRWCGAQAIIAACVLLWLPALLYQMQVAPAVTAFWGEGLADYGWLALSLLLNSRPRAAALLPLWLLLAALSWVLIAVALLRARWHDDGLAARAFGWPALLLLLLVIWMQVVASRYLLVLLPGAALAIGLGAAALRQRLPRLGAALPWLLVAGLLAYRAPALLAPPDEQRWHALADHVAQHADPTRDVVLFHPPWDQRVFEYYYRGPALPLLGAHHYDDFYYTQGHQLRSSWTPAEVLAALPPGRRVWVFYNQTTHTVPRLDWGYREAGHWNAGRLELILYEPPTSTP